MVHIHHYELIKTTLFWLLCSSKTSSLFTSQFGRRHIHGQASPTLVDQEKSFFKQLIENLKVDVFKFLMLEQSFLYTLQLFHIANFNICNTLSLESIKTSSFQPMSSPYYCASLHVSYDANGIDEFYKISQIIIASYRKQVSFDVWYIENTINPYYFTIWKFYKHTSFSFNNMSFTSCYYHRCYYNKIKSKNDVWVPCDVLCCT